MLPSDDTSRRVRRFGLSSVLRIASAGLQLWGGVSGHEYALIVEAGEELSDGLTFAAVAEEARTDRRGLSRKARHIAMFFAIGAAILASFGTIVEIVADGAAWLTPLDGIHLGAHQAMAAFGALGLSSIVFVLNRTGRKSSRVSDRFAYRDSLRDFMIPGAVLVLAAMRAPHAAEYLLETGGVIYGWYNAVQLYRGWRTRRQATVLSVWDRRFSIARTKPTAMAEITNEPAISRGW